MDTTRRLGLLAIVAAIVLATGIALAPERIWSNMLVVTFYLATLGLGGSLFML